MWVFRGNLAAATEVEMRTAVQKSGTELRQRQREGVAVVHHPEAPSTRSTPVRGRMCLSSLLWRLHRAETG